MLLIADAVVSEPTIVAYGRVRKETTHFQQSLLTRMPSAITWGIAGRSSPVSSFVLYPESHFQDHYQIWHVQSNLDNNQIASYYMWILG